MNSAQMTEPAEPSVTVAEQSGSSISGPLNNSLDPHVERRVGRRVAAIAAVAVVLLSVTLIAGTLPRLRQERKVNAAAAEIAAAPQRVTVTKVEAMAPEAERVLPGNCLPLLEAAIFARTNGYIKS